MDVDVLIVGGGPAGLSTWLHLRERAPELAARTVLVERATYPREKICGGGVTWPGTLLLADLGIRVRSPSVAAHEVEFRFGEEPPVVLRGREAVRVVRRREFDHELARHAVDRGLRLHAGEAVEGLARDGAYVRVRTDRGAYRARMVVGADGAHSTVRAWLGAPGPPRLARLIKAVGPAAGPAGGRLDHTVIFDFGAVASGLQGYVWHFPCIESGQRATDHGVYDSRVLPDARRADLRTVFESDLRGCAPGLGPASWSSHPVRPFSKGALLCAPHVLLVGDAAGVDPVLGEGISPSLEYGEVAAEALIEAFESGDFSAGGYPEILFGCHLGNSLMRRAELATQLYGSPSEGLGAIRSQVSEWVSAGLP